MTDLNAYVAGCTSDFVDAEFPEMEDIMHAVLMRGNTFECPVCYTKHYSYEGTHLGSYLWFSCYNCGTYFHAVD